MQRTLVEAADTIQMFIHLLRMEYKEEESTERWFLKSILKITPHPYFQLGT